jgi:hypothetical protein
MEHLRDLPLDEQYARTEAERARLEAIVLEQQETIRKLSGTNEALRLRNNAAGKSNMALNKDLGRVQRELPQLKASDAPPAWDF